MIDYKRLRYLNQKVKNNEASSNEKDEYMLALYDNGSITKSQYDKYLKDKNTNDIVATAVTIGGILLLGYIIKNLISE